MRNVFIAPTKGPSRLFTLFGILSIDGNYIVREDAQIENQGIYITNEDSVNPGDHVFNSFNNTVYKIVRDDSPRIVLGIQGNLPLSAINKEHYHKIIISDDMNLIESGIQEVSTKFMKWFSNNMECKCVKIENGWRRFDEKLGYLSRYNIIISEVKVGDVTEKGVVDTVGNCANCGVEFHIHKESSKDNEKLYTVEEIKDALDEEFGRGDFHRDEYKNRVMKKLGIERFN
jgi:hypothetical protein